MPFHHTIDWAAAGVFFNISDYKSWLGEEFQWSLSTTQNVLTPNDAQWWSPDADIYSSLINIDDASEMVAHLRHMPQSAVEAKLKYIGGIRSRFMFATTLTTPPNAVNTILSESSKKEIGQKTVSKLPKS
ncbi:MAG: hypothetical protein FRX49_08774 [Trebouxia sp. A1-2]|nr:MAG: hypothetical protein FRX49_08774 [Trebouxia sp. A1-2]